MKADVQSTFRYACKEYIGIGKRYTMADVERAVIDQFGSEAPHLRTLYTVLHGPQDVSLRTAMVVMAVVPEIKDLFDLLWHGDEDGTPSDCEIHAMNGDVAEFSGEISRRFADDGRFCHRDRASLGKRGMRLVGTVLRRCRALVKPGLIRVA